MEEPEDCDMLAPWPDAARESEPVDVAAVLLAAVVAEVGALCWVDEVAPIVLREAVSRALCVPLTAVVFCPEVEDGLPLNRFEKD